MVGRDDRLLSAAASSFLCQMVDVNLASVWRGRGRRLRRRCERPSQCLRRPRAPRLRARLCLFRRPWYRDVCYQQRRSFRLPGAWRRVRRWLWRPPLREGRPRAHVLPRLQCSIKPSQKRGSVPVAGVQFPTIAGVQFPTSRSQGFSSPPSQGFSSPSPSSQGFSSPHHTRRGSVPHHRRGSVPHHHHRRGSVPHITLAGVQFPTIAGVQFPTSHSQGSATAAVVCPCPGHEGELALALGNPRFGHEGELALWRYNGRRNVPRTFLPCPLDLYIPFADVPFSYTHLRPIAQRCLPLLL